ncbi:hypothetical protein Mapa_016563 [Marchantia paleacea]|nr:hypothetical protein Mapa_016563 [Marchantia paleacea]
MQGSGYLLANESPPPEGIAWGGEAPADRLGKHISDAVDIITNGISATGIPELETAAKPSAIPTPGHETESSSGVKDDILSVNLNVGHRAQTASGEESEISSEYGAGESDGLVGAGRSGYDAGDYGTFQIVSASSPLGKAGEGTVLEEISSNELKSKNTSTSGASSSSGPGRMRVHYKEDNPGPLKQREDSSCSSAGQKKASETLAIHRWKIAYAFAKNSNVYFLSSAVTSEHLRTSLLYTLCFPGTVNFRIFRVGIHMLVDLEFMSLSCCVQRRFQNRRP